MQKDKQNDSNGWDKVEKRLKKEAKSQAKEEIEKQFEDWQQEQAAPEMEAPEVEVPDVDMNFEAPDLGLEDNPCSAWSCFKRIFKCCCSDEN